ncbi:MAG: hypothetical protein HY751_13170 [Nitrospinae bacterium]|nr:hypothetical protein [Nitrospinota bacterium]
MAAMILTFTSACATAPTATVRGGGGPTMAQAMEERYNGPKARLSVVKFVDKTGGKLEGSMGEGMADMLTTALFNTNRFIMLDRQDLNAVINEQDFAAAGRISEATAAQTGQIEGAELLVFGAVTGFEKDAFGAGGILIGALTLGASIAINANNQGDTPIGAVTYTESYITTDIKIVDARTGRVVHANSVEGRTQDWGGGIVGGVGGGWSRVPVGLGGFQGTGAEQAARVCIDSAVAEIVRNTPEEYYMHWDDQDGAQSGLILRFNPTTLPNANPSGIKGPRATLVDNGKDYSKLLAELNINEQTSPPFNFEAVSLIAVFAGEKPAQGHRIGVERVVAREKTVEVVVRQWAPVEAQNLPQQKDWPYDIVLIEKQGKPVKFIWAGN